MKHPGEDEEHDLPKPPDISRYILDPSRNLYVPACDDTGNYTANEKPGRNPKPPLHVDVRTDRRILCISVLTLVGVGFAAFYAGRQSDASTKAAHAAKSAADTAASQLQLSEHPWLAIKDVSVKSLTYPDGPTKPRIVLEYQIENIGHGIAILVGVFSEFMPERSGAEVIYDSIQQNCAEGVIPGNDPEWGVIPSPDHPMTYDAKELTIDARADQITIRNVGCVLYRSMADDPRLRIIHHTSFNSRVTMKENGVCPKQNQGVRINFADEPSAESLCSVDLLILGKPALTDYQPA